MLTLVILMSILYFASPLFDKYRPDFEQFVSNVIRQPVQIAGITVGSRGLEPLIRFHHVVVFNGDKTKKLLQARELQIGIDLVGSLFKLQLKPGLILIRGSEFTVHQTKDGKTSVAGIPLASDEEKTSMVSEDLSSWLLGQVRVDLEDVVLKWYLADGRVVKITDLYLKLYNGTLQHNLKAGGKLVQKYSPAVFTLDLNLHGNFLLNHTISPVVGAVTIDNWFCELDPEQFSGGGFFVMPEVGDINLSVKQSKISTKLFRQPMPVKSFESVIKWTQNSDGLKIKFNNLDFKDDLLFLFGEGECWFQTGAKIPVVDIKLGLKVTNLAKAKLYYPVNLMPADATAWLDKAFVSSKLVSGNVILRGPLDKFPFDNNEGQFLVDTTIRDVHLNYDADWPHIENISGKMVFSNRSLLITSNSAKIVNEPIESVKVTIKDLDLPILDVDGVVNADSNSGLKFVNSSPLKNTIGYKLQPIGLTGPMKLTLKMHMPLSDDVPEKDTKIDGIIELDNNKMRAADWGFEVDNFKGKLSFTADDMLATGLNGELFSKPVNIDIGTLKAKSNDVVTWVKITGSAKVQDFERAFAVSLTPYVIGEFNYNALLELHDSSVRNVFKLESGLRGVRVDLPEPFAKKSDSDYKFNLACYFGGNELPQVMINYNDQINSALMFKKSGAKSLQILAGEIKFDAAPAKISTKAGLLITGNVSKLDWLLWKEYLAKAKVNVATAGSMIRQVSLNIGELRVLGQIFKKATLKVLPKNKDWEIALLTPNIDGKVYLPHDPNGCIQGIFKKLYFSEEQQGWGKLKPQDLSPLNFTINELRYGNKNFSRVELVAQRQPNGLKINKLTLSDAKYRVEASGDWLFSGEKQSSIFRGKINSADIGGLLKQWDLTNNMDGGNGSANFILRWDDSPYNPSMQKVKGAFMVRINKGRIVNLSKQTENKLDFGRVLNMLSLQTLPQRLSLDFSDLHHGFSFNTLDGGVELNNGNALLKKVILDGQVAYIRAQGRIGLQAKDYDMMISAVPHHIASSILPVTGAITGGPIGGVIGFIADKVISLGIKKGITNTYHVTGSWDNPKIVKA